MWRGRFAARGRLVLEIGEGVAASIAVWSHDARKHVKEYIMCLVVTVVGVLPGVGYVGLVWWENSVIVGSERAQREVSIKLVKERGRVEC